MPEAVPTTTQVSTEVGPVIIPDLDSFPPTGTPKHTKLASWDFYRSIDSPQRIVAPMVDQSELPWRILSRRYGSDLVYTPMINAKLFADESSKKKKVKYQEINFNREFAEEGSPSLSLPDSDREDTDRPLFVQFCANDPATLLRAAQVVEDRCDAVDLNLGCPQHIARRGHYGSFLMEDWGLIFRLINILHLELKVPVTAKMRVYESMDKTIAYAKMLERAGAQMITVHGRTRGMKGHHTGLADWEKIERVKKEVKVPVIANGNVLYPQDWREALERTGADGVMSAEGNLYNPAIFFEQDGSETMFPGQKGFPSITEMAREYLDIVGKLRTPTQSSAIKAHLFRLCRPALEVHRDLREVLGKSRFESGAIGAERVKSYAEFVEELGRRLEKDMRDEKWKGRPEPALPGSVSYLTEAGVGGRPVWVPHWLAQPYFRPPLVTQEEKGGEEKEDRKRRVLESTAAKAGKVEAQSMEEGKTNGARERSDSAERELQEARKVDEKRFRVE